MTYQPFIVVLFALLALSCKTEVHPTVFDYPENSLPEANTSLVALWERAEQNQNVPLLLSTEEDSLWVHAYVTSSDEGGNFYKALYVQDQPQRPQRALRLLLDQTALSDRFPVGRKLAICLNGLGVGQQNGMLTLGQYDGAVIQPLAPYVFAQHIKGSSGVVRITAQPVALDAIQPGDAGKWVRLEGVQFARSVLGKTFSGDGLDTYDGLRRVVQCANHRSLMLSTSVYADFKSLELPSASGNIQGILTKDYYGRQWVLQPNFSTDLTLTDARCDPFFEQDFETAYLGDFQHEGWSNFALAGTPLWEVYEDTESLGRSLRMGSYRSKDAVTEVWLVTPKMDLSSLQQPTVDFRSSVQYADKSVLEVFYSTTWNGEPSALASATWEHLPFLLANADDHPSEWIDAGPLALPSSTSLYLAFRYSGSGKTANDGTFEIDDIRIYDWP